MDELESLVELARAVDADMVQRRDAFAALVVRFQDMVFAYAFALLQDDQLAQDAAQEAFTTAYSTLTQLREPKAFPGWLRRIVLTSCNRLVRKKRVATQSLDITPSLGSDQPDPLTTIEARELKRQIYGAIRMLPERQRLAVLLHYVDGYSLRQVAEFLEVSMDAVKKQLQRARYQLHKEMVDILSDDLRGRRPSRDDQFINRVWLFTSLQAADEQGEVAMIELMLVDGLDVNAKDGDGRTLLHWAAYQGHADVTELLLQHGAVLDIQDKSGKTPLAIATDNKHVEVVMLLCRASERP
ncbi:MAG: sigma-70 family RNA polymerase sigma factor [Chloroflexi bacterium]|nr:sigma-70 family RNA polymerase sigma factor [Chloroflexota bacterium]